MSFTFNYIQISNWPNIIALHWTLILVIPVTHIEPDQTDHISLSVSLNCLRSIDTYSTSLYYTFTLIIEVYLWVAVVLELIWTDINVITSNLNIGWAVNCLVKHTTTLWYLSMTSVLFVNQNYSEFPEYYSKDVVYNKNTGCLDNLYWWRYCGY